MSTLTSEHAFPALAPQHGTARIRLADSGDVGQIHRMTGQLAEYMQITQYFTATEQQLLSMLFPTPARAPPFNTFTALLLDVHPSASPSTDCVRSNLQFRPVLLPTRLPPPGSDPDASSFASAQGGGWVTAGFVLFFPSCSNFQGQTGFFVQNLFVRGPYRRRGLGKALLGAVAAQANEMGMGLIDLFVLEGNKDAIRFYEGMGAHVMPGWCHSRLCGAALLGYGRDAGADLRKEEDKTGDGAGKNVLSSMSTAH